MRVKDLGAKFLSTALFWIVLSAALLGSLPVRAEIGESEKEIADRRTERMLELAREAQIDLPATLATDQDLYVLITQGAAIADIRILMRTSTPPLPVAQCIEKAANGTTLEEKKVWWTKEDDYNCVKIVDSRGRFGAREAAIEAPIGRIVAALRTQGYVPHVCLRIPAHVTAPLLPYAKSLKGQNYAWFDLTNIPQDATVRTQAVLSSGLIAACIAFFAFVPTVGLLGLITALIVGSRTSIPIQRRRYLYPKLVQRPVFIAIGLHAPFVIFYLQSTACRAMADVWFGSAAITVFAPFLLFPPMLMMFVLPFSTRLEKRLFGPSEADKATQELTKEVEKETSPEEHAFRRKKMLLQFIPLTLALVVIVGAPLVPHPPRVPISQFAFIIGMLINLVGGALIRRLLKKEEGKYERQSVDEATTRRAEGLASRIGVASPKVIIVDTVAGRQYASAAILADTIYLSRKALEIFTPAELDFVLAHELAHRKARHMRTRRIGILAGTLASSLMFLMIPLRLQFHWTFPPIGWLFALSMGGLAWNMIFLKRLSRRQEYESDRIALECTGDLVAARSALTRLAQHSPLPYAHEVEDLSTHPAMSKRIAALQTAAQELRLAY